MNSFDSKFRTYSTYSKKNPTGLIYYYKPVKYLSVHAIIPLYLESLFISLLLSSNGWANLDGKTNPLGYVLSFVNLIQIKIIYIIYTEK